MECVKHLKKAYCKEKERARKTGEEEYEQKRGKKRKKKSFNDLQVNNLKVQGWSP